MFGHDNQDNSTQQIYEPTEHTAPAAPLADDQAAPDAPVQDVGDGTDAAGDSTAPVVVTPPAQPVNTPHPAATDSLLNIKQEALQALTPLVGQLDQTPEEQFRTTMMMIQASDNHDLVQVAYEAAKKISDEKERAQALLDIVNEINYFTQHTQA